MGEAAGPADRGENKVCGRVVAPVDRGGAEIANRHSAFGGAGFGHRRVFEKIVRPVWNDAAEPLLAVVDAFQHGRRRERFERAAHWEAFDLSTAAPLSALRVDDRDPQPAAFARLDSREAPAHFANTVVNSGADWPG